MKTRFAAIAVLIGIGAGSAVVLHVHAGGDKVAFPENYAQGVMYYSFD